MPTHGSLTKAGKVKSQTPKVEAIVHESPIPRVRFKKIHSKRFLLNRKLGQNWQGQRRRFGR